MAEEGKKISFGFSKVIKKPQLQNAPQKEEKKIEYIESLDNKAIKIIGLEESKEVEPLIIPMLGSKTWHDRIENKIDADIFEPKDSETDKQEDTLPQVTIKQENSDEFYNGSIQNNNGIPMEVTEIKQESGVEETLTLEERAAREILTELNSETKSEEVTFTVPIKEEDKDNLQGKNESTLEDYENIPIEHFGMAMLRGMGWKPGQGIGKNQKVVAPKIPELRPKGLGLGADKLAVQKKLESKLSTQSAEDQELKLTQGCFVKITAGKHIDSYGKVEGLNDDSGRVVIRLAIGDHVLSVNELFVQPVTSKEYSENSKILNVKKYQKFKDKEFSQDRKSKEIEAITVHDSDDDQQEISQKSKKPKMRVKSSENHSNAASKSRRKRHSSESNNEDEGHIFKKSKNRRCDNSCEPSNRKNKKSESSDDDSSPRRESKKIDRPINNKEEKQKSSKKSKKHKCYDNTSEFTSRKNKRSKSSDNDSSPRRQSGRRDSSNSSEDKRQKSSKKSKKHKNRDNSSEHSNRKQKRKDKEREKTRYRRSNSSERTKQRSRKRSRSRSNSPRNRRKNRSRSNSPRR